MNAPRAIAGASSLQIARGLAAVRNALRAAKPLPDGTAFVAAPAADLVALAEAIDALLAGKKGLRLTMGLRPGRGERTSRTLLEEDLRNALLRQAAEKLLPGHPIDQQARRLFDELRKYEIRVWPRERHEPECPKRHAGCVEAIFWAILKIRPHSLTLETIRQILSAS